jgi:hypothetical protein
LHRVPCGLPQTPLAIRARTLRQHALKAGWHVLGTEIRQPAARKLAKVRYYLLKALENPRERESRANESV